MTKQGVKLMMIDAAIYVALLISILVNVVAFYYVRDLLGRLGWLTQNLDNLEELIKGYQNHLTNIYELEKFYGDEDLRLLTQHTSDLIEVMKDYLEVGLDTELIEKTNSEEENIDDEETKKE